MCDFLTAIPICFCSLSTSSLRVIFILSDVPKEQTCIAQMFSQIGKEWMLSAAAIESCNPKLIYFDQSTINYARVAAFRRFCCHVALFCLHVLQEENIDSHLSGDHNPWLFGVGD